MNKSLKIGLGLAAGATLVYGATRVIPNPFSEDAEAVYQHATQTDLRVKWNLDGAPGSIPIIDQSLVEPDMKYFEAAPGIKANPEEAGGLFRFDYEIGEQLQIGRHSGEVVFKVNSADNSIYFSGYDLRRSSLAGEGLRRLEQAGYQTDFAIRNAARGWMLFATHAQEGRICIYLPQNLGASQAFAEDYLYQAEFLESVKHTEQMGGKADAEAHLQPMQGRVTQPGGRQQYIDMWFGRDPAQVATGVPIMGLGVGIFKDFQEKKQKFLAITRTGDAWFKLLHLEAIEPWAVQTEGYRVINFNFGTAVGIDEAEDIAVWLQAKQEEIERIRQERKECPPHQAGSACRREAEARIKAIQQELEARAQELLQTRVPPIR